MKIKYRKAKPQPPRHYWLEDCVVFCNKETQCGSCKWLKEYAAYEKEACRASGSCSGGRKIP